MEFMRHAQHIVQHQNLSVNTITGTNAYNGYAYAFGYFFGQFGGYFFQYNAKTTYALQHFGIFNQAFGFLFFFRPNRIGAEFVNRLWGQAQMSHYRNTGVQYAFNGFLHFFATFHFYGMSAAFFHYPDGIAQGFLQVTLVASKRQVYNY